eukprot:4229-Heterococcus_DN1.PRE.2
MQCLKRQCLKRQCFKFLGARIMSGSEGAATLKYTEAGDALIVDIHALLGSIDKKQANEILLRTNIAGMRTDTGYAFLKCMLSPSQRTACALCDAVPPARKSMLHAPALCQGQGLSPLQHPLAPVCALQAQAEKRSALARQQYSQKNASGSSRMRWTCLECCRLQYQWCHTVALGIGVRREPLNLFTETARPVPATVHQQQEEHSPLQSTFPASELLLAAEHRIHHRHRFGPEVLKWCQQQAVALWSANWKISREASVTEDNITRFHRVTLPK